ncbi:putative membrane protein [Caenispirillum salinarum AK4]|uniref:Putative membrane protein n=1 Tax=Caenispirillum salinarum AK4 TaxID=1238182 RepID=K9GYE9_9PROT|nr:putative membrane protein [Caenispirillum salinarum AK4]
MAALLLLPVLPVLADEDDHEDHERARRALEAGDTLPLAALLERSGIESAGRLIEVELEREHGRLVYELKVLTPLGRVIEHYFDARSGKLLKTEGHDE